MKICAIDPGSRYTAFAVRDTKGATLDDQLLGWRVIDRKNLEHQDLTSWLRQVTQYAGHLLQTHAPVRCVIEAVTAPNPHLGMTNPAGIIETASVLGAIVGMYGAVIIPAGSYGAPVASRSILRAAYPTELVGPRETTGAGKGIRQHARAAFDLAAAAPRYIHTTR
jgi:Holliday junction resolvasome RuvABC endonuclease subunit